MLTITEFELMQLQNILEIATILFCFHSQEQNQKSE